MKPAAGLVVLLLAAAQEAGSALREVRVAMRDGQELAADLYLPGEGGPCPVVVVQTPYDRHSLRPVFSGRPRPGSAGAAAVDRARYAYLVADWRGFFGSRGAGKPESARARGRDGYDLVEWAAAQPWCNGRVGTWGPSALGVQQFATAMEQPPHLVCSAPLMAGLGQAWEQYYPGGVLLEGYLATLDRLGFGVSRLVRAFPDPSALAWRDAEARSRRPERIQVPMLLISGWWDNHPHLVIRTFHDLRERGGDPQARKGTRLLLGPWDHMSLGKAGQGDLRFPVASGMPGEWTRLFFEYWLLEERDNGWRSQPRVRWWPAGEGRWRDAEDWPPPGVRMASWRLGADGVLYAPGAPAPGLAGDRRYSHDPRSPAPTLGGANLPPLPHGPTDQAALDDRPDVLHYSTGPLERPLRLAGRVEVDLGFTADRPDCDFIARLAWRHGGQALLLAEGARRARYRGGRRARLLEPGQPARLTVILSPVAATLPAGDALELYLSSADWPRYERNPHTGSDHWSEEEALPLAVTIHHGGGFASSVRLPSLPEE